MDLILVRGNGALSGQIPHCGGKKCVFDIDARHFVKRRACHTHKCAAPFRHFYDAAAFAVLWGRDQRFEQRAGDCNVLHGLDNWRADYDIVRKMRASNLVLGPLLARFGQAIVSLRRLRHWGASDGPDITALEALGAEIELKKEGYLHAKALLNGLKGERIAFDLPLLERPKNFLLYGLFGEGNFCRNAREPEIVDLVSCLRKWGRRSKAREVRGL